MPYVDPAARKRLQVYETTTLPQTPGELNFVFSRLIDRVLGHTLSYDKINTVIGVLECCKLEAFRRIGANYEDRKIAENGDVFLER